MKVLLDIKDDKAPALLEVLKGLSYVTTETISDDKSEILSELKNAVQQVKSAKKGEITLKSLDEFIAEL